MAGCDNNVSKGREAALLVRDDLDTKWQIVGGVKSRGATTDNPVEDITSSSTPGYYSESEFTGYRQKTHNISGVFDNRTGQLINIGGQDYEVAPVSRLDYLAHNGNSCGKFKILHPHKTEEGTYTITNYSDSGDTPGLLNFSATLQTKEEPTIIYF